mgnify:CR=1 FL=1
MADNFLPYQNPASTDAKLDTESLPVGANTVHRERVQITGTAAGDIAPVSATDGVLVTLGANNDVTVSGVSTAANQSTIIGHVDGIETLLTTIAGAVSGTEMQVDVLTLPNVTIGAAIPAGTNNIGDVDVLTLPSIPAGTNNIGDVDVLTVPADPFGTNADAAATAGSTGSIQAKLRLITSQLDAIQTAVQLIDNAISGSGVNVSQINGVAPSMGNGTSGTGVQRVTIASDSTGTVAVTQSTASSLNAQVVGSVAHDGIDSGNPVKVGLKAIAHGTNPTAVAASDRTDWYANRAGVPFVIGGHPNVQTFRLRWTTAQTDAALITVGAGAKIVLTAIHCTMDQATSAATAVRVGFGTANTPSNSATSGVVLDHDGIAPGSGVSYGNAAGILAIGGDNEDLRITAEAATGGSGIIYGSYYTIES